ncbi:MAG: response regulator [Desulfobacterales bacterium]
MICILIADDHFIVREGLKKIIREAGDMSITGEAETGHAVMDRIAKNQYDVLILDISMPGRRGLDLLKSVKQKQPDLPVLILTIYSENQYAVRALKAGAAGYLTKDKLSEEIIAAVRKVAAGGKYVSAELAEHMADSLDQDYDVPLHTRLSDREYAVFDMIARGRSISEIAEALFISPKTVSTYRARVLEKMNMKTNAELVLYAITQELIEIPE